MVTAGLLQPFLVFDDDFNLALPLNQRIPQPFRSGPPCQPYSKMGLRKQDTDEKFVAHQAYYKQAPKNGEIHIIENVTEYEIQLYVDRFFGEGWSCHTAKVDPRLWGLGCSRPRAYGIVWNKDVLQWDVNFPFFDVLESLKARPQMNASDYFWMPVPASPLTSSEDLQLNSGF